MSATRPQLHTMLFSVILIICVVTTTSEWVEISQQHYRKPVRITYNPTSDVTYKPVPERSTMHYNGQFDRKEDFNKPNYDIEDEQNQSHKVLSNVSITDTWNRNTFKVPAIIQRIHIDKHDEDHVPYLDPPEFVTKHIENDGKVSATVERVSNLGSIKRVQLSDAPVKSPTINDISKTNYRNNFPTAIKDEFEIKSDIFKDERIPNVKMSNGVKPDNKIEQPVNNYKIMTSTDKPSQNVFHINKLDSGKNEIKHIDANKKIPDIEKDIPYTNIQQTQSKPTEKVIDSNIDKILTFDKSKDQFKKLATSAGIEDNSFQEDTQNNQETKPSNSESEFSQEQNNGSQEESSSSQEKTKPGDINMQTMENLMKFMKVVTETISKNTKRGVHGKVKYLNDLKDTLLDSIKSRIDATWPDDDTARRRSRSTARGHVEFPSSESSLMTISFLTFAVFLIKLVLQVIQTYKNKTMVMAPLVVATAGRAVRKLRNFHDLH